jgi:hypothetical protein
MKEKTMAKPRLNVVVLGDSVMWGQGLREEDKFSTQAVQQIGALLQREAVIVRNMAHSGASIRSARTQDEMKDERKAFVDTYPSLFHAPGSEEDFIEHNNQEPARFFGEIPSMFPTVSYQVQSVPEVVARSTELVFLNGGGNDLGFEDYLNPTKHSDDFVEHYGPLFQEYFYLRTKSLLLQAREKFPKAVLILIGYYAPFTPLLSHDEVKALLEHESGKPDWEIWFNDHIHEFVDVDHLVRVAQFRAHEGFARGLYWQRRAVLEANEDPKFRGPGILFIHPRFGPENTVFAPHSFIHREYELGKVKDNAKKIREENYPRLKQESDLKALLDTLNAIKAAFMALDNGKALGFAPLARLLVIKLLGVLDGPTSLRKALDNFQEALDNFQGSLIDPKLNALNFVNLSATLEVLLGGLEAELKRITTVHRASFMHPNERGAQRYTNVIVKRYTERYHHIHLREDLLKLQQRDQSTKPVGLKKSLRRYRLGSQTSLREITQMMLVDSIALEVVTDVADFISFDSILLNLGGTNLWSLPAADLFRSDTTTFLRFDAHGTHLGSITQFTLIWPILGHTADPHEIPPWKLRKITLHINGKEVFSTSISTSLRVGEELTFPYPASEE